MFFVTIIVIIFVIISITIFIVIIIVVFYLYSYTIIVITKLERAPFDWFVWIAERHGAAGCNISAELPQNDVHVAMSASWPHIHVCTILDPFMIPKINFNASAYAQLITSRAPETQHHITRTCMFEWWPFPTNPNRPTLLYSNCSSSVQSGPSPRNQPQRRACCKGAHAEAPR